MITYRFLKKTLTFILAGGQGERLYPLTKDRSKPSVPFGGVYRIIDFPLSNCINSDLRKIIVLTQYKSLSLDRHIKTAWNLFTRELDGYVDVVPAQQRIDSNWYKGTADAIFQNIYSIEMEKPEYVLVLSGDHVYKMDYRKLIGYHIEKNADLTIAAIEVPRAEASRFGILEVDAVNRVRGFEEKPASPKPIPGKNDSSFVSMGIYVFKTDRLIRYVSEDHRQEGANDFGKDIIPRIYDSDRVFAYEYVAKESAFNYWRDIGTIKSYYDATLDLVSTSPQLNLYDRNWPIRTHMEQFPPAKTVHNDVTRRGVAVESLISNGSIISGGSVFGSVISPGVRINSYAEVYDSIIFSRVNVGRGVKIRNAIVDKNVVIPDNTVIGFDRAEDEKRFTVSEEGIVVIPKSYIF